MKQVLKYFKEVITLVSAVLGIAMFVSQPFLNTSLQWSKIIGISLFGIAGIFLTWLVVAAVLVSLEKRREKKRIFDVTFAELLKNNKQLVSDISSLKIKNLKLEKRIDDHEKIITDLRNARESVRINKLISGQ